MSDLVSFLLIFVVVGWFFVVFHLMLGSLVRPRTPKSQDPEKFTIYECGEPTIGSAWIQFDLRFYVIALLFVIFDVEVAFFFPWAVVFGKAATLANPNLPAKQRVATLDELVPRYSENQEQLDRVKQSIPLDRKTLEERREDLLKAGLVSPDRIREADAARLALDNSKAAASLAWVAFWDIVVFFGVLLVGFAYLWKRGDLHWVRSLAAERPAAAPASRPEEPVLVGTGGSVR